MSIKDLLLNKHKILKSRAKGLEGGEQVALIFRTQFVGEGTLPNNDTQ